MTSAAGDEFEKDSVARESLIGVDCWRTTGQRERVIAPRFDNPVLLVLNVLSMVTFVAVASLLIWSWRRGRTPQWRDLILLVHFSAAGWYVPVFPLVWLAMEREDNRMPDGAVRLPFQ